MQNARSGVVRLPETTLAQGNYVGIPGEIIFQEMRRHPKLIAQVSNIYTIRLLKIVKKWYSLFVQLYVAGVTGDVADPTKYYIHILA